jgi:RNA polymerase sigma factor (sigma-70 family)
MIILDMAPKHGLLDCEAVLAELGWLKGLARGLGADPHAAEDLTQATFLTALEHPPGTDRPVRGWLATVLRNLFNESKRRRLRREAREARAARPEADRSAAGIVERAAIQKRAVDAVMALDEPYRTTVLLRFFEGLPPRKIAARTGTPVATVKTRLARALEQLRSRLDREHGGDRRAWLFCLLAPLPKAAFTASAIGVVVMEAKAKLAAAAAVLLIGVAGWFAYDHFVDDRPTGVPTPESSAPEAPGARAPGVAAADGLAPIKPRSYVESADSAPAAQPVAGRPGASAASDAAPAGARIRGKVIDSR